MTVVKDGAGARSWQMCRGRVRAQNGVLSTFLSGVEIRDQSALESGDGVPQQQLAFFQAGQAQLIGRSIFSEPVDGIIQVAVFNAELRKLPANGIEWFVIHWVRVAHRCDINESVR